MLVGCRRLGWYVRRLRRGWVCGSRGSGAGRSSGLRWCRPCSTGCSPPGCSGQGRIAARPYTPEEQAALGDALPVLGETTFDVYLNDRAFWRNVPTAVWDYKLGGYQVLKKWLSYRERQILGRALLPEDVQHFTDTARRIAAIQQLTANK